MNRFDSCSVSVHDAVGSIEDGILPVSITECGDEAVNPALFLVIFFLFLFSLTIHSR